MAAIGRTVVNGGAVTGTVPGDELVGGNAATHLFEQPENLDFTLTTSVTERQCADLAETLGGVADGQGLREQIEKRGLFLRALDEWFRPPPLRRLPPSRTAARSTDENRWPSLHRVTLVRHARPPQ
ncbi:hypothetical protein [Rhodococcus jostii]|uniref:hypothetical protein n=1 Tax=Rhodococcus jostii TaxID=132919 RepID=UPI00363FBC73